MKPPDSLAAVLILNQLQAPAGVAQVKEQFIEMGHNHAEAELWPEVAVEIVGEELPPGCRFEDCDRDLQAA